MPEVRTNASPRDRLGSACWAPQIRYDGPPAVRGRGVGGRRIRPHLRHMPHDPELAAKAEKVMSLMGGGTMSEQGFGSSQKIFPNVSTHVLSLSVVTAPNGTKWQIHIIDCTYNKEDPSKVGLKSIEIIPYPDRDAPKGFSWYAPDDQWPYGIRLIMNWNDWNPATNSKLPSVPS